MPYINYVEKDFRKPSLAIIGGARKIIKEYAAQGFSLTLRQLYYQFVARAWIENTQRSYKRLGSIINDARLAGYVDWAAIEDRTRRLEKLEHWDSPASVLKTAARLFRRDRWADQQVRIEVWIEKEALAGVFEPICKELEVPFFCCRGYPSQSEVWSASQRLIEYQDAGQQPIILHFGDHDPSGMDMTRDIVDRMELFGVDLLLHRMALNIEQVEEFKPPPNPAKLTDSRAGDYVARYGWSSWELDALNPTTLAHLVSEQVLDYRDEEVWDASVEKDEEDVATLKWVSSNWGKVRTLSQDDSND